MIEVVQAYDRTPIRTLQGDDATLLEAKISIAKRLFLNRQSWLKPYQKIEVLHRLAHLMTERRVSGY